MATRMLTPLASRWASAERLLPPMMRPKVWTSCAISSFITPYVCMASSRVGDRITTPVPEGGWRGRSLRVGTQSKEAEPQEEDSPFLGMNLSLLMSSMDGMRKANVFPLPVLAAARMSLRRNHGMS